MSSIAKSFPPPLGLLFLTINRNEVLLPGFNETGVAGYLFHNSFLGTSPVFIVEISLPN